MAAASNPSPTMHSPRSAAAAYESSGGASPRAAAGIRSPRHRNRGRVGAAGNVSTARTPVIRIGDVESIVPSSLTSSAATGTVVSPASYPMPDGAREETISSSAYDRSPIRTFSTSSLPEDGATEAQQENSDNGISGSNAVKKPAWNKPSVTSAAKAEVTSVMGAEAWPALSEATRVSSKSLSSDVPKSSSDGSLSAAQGTGTSFPSSDTHSTDGHAIPSSVNHAPYNRQKSIKRAGGHPNNNATANGGFSVPSPRNSGMDAAPNSTGKHGNFANDSSSRDNLHQDGGQRAGVGSQSHGGNDHQPQRNSFRRGNGGSHSRGDGSHHNGYGGRRSDQDRGNQDWNQNRSFPGRDMHMQPQRGPSRPLIRGPTSPSPPFVPPAPVVMNPFGVPLVYHDGRPVYYGPGSHVDPLRPVSFGPPMMPLVYAFPDPQLPSKILNQVDYYFSNENLITDVYLRKNMDDQGWVPIELIASFKRVKQLTDNIQLILDTIRSSSIVEVQGGKVRRRNEWMRWLMPQSATVLSRESSDDMISAKLQNTTLDDKTPKHASADTHLSSSSSGEWNSYSMQSSGEKTSQVQGGNEPSALGSR